MTRLIVFAGPPLSGKSSLASVIGFDLGIVHLSVDRIAQQCFNSSDYSLEDRNAFYKEMHRRAKLYLKRGEDVIVDATYARESVKKELEKVIEKTGAKKCWIECMVSPDVAVERYKNRTLNNAHPATDMSIERARKLAKDYPYLGNGLLLHTKMDLGERTRVVKEALNSEAWK